MPGTTSYDKATQYLTPGARLKLTKDKTIGDGLYRVYVFVRRCARQGRLPTTENVLDLCRNSREEWKAVVKVYLAGGGTVTAMATTVFHGHGRVTLNPPPTDQMAMLARALLMGGEAN